MEENIWKKAELSEGKEPVIPLAGQAVVLYCCPYHERRAWECDIGSLYTGPESEEAEEAEKPGTLFWNSAFGIDSGFDGMKFENILRDYEVYFAHVPPLEAGRFPTPITDSAKKSGGLSASF